jgi:SAM-dependent methyltransferase
MTSYAFPHTETAERRRLELLEERLDPITIRRMGRLALPASASCLEVGGGRGSIARYLCELVGPAGHVTATDLEPEFLTELSLANLEVMRHDVTTDSFPEASFDLIHARAVLMHLPHRMEILRRMVSWLRPGGWLLVEDADFGMWVGDFEPMWARHPVIHHEAFPNGSLSQGRALLRQIHQLGLERVGADAELDVVQHGTPLCEFYKLSFLAQAPRLIESGAITSHDASELIARIDSPDFLACGFAHIGAWGRRPDAPSRFSNQYAATGLPL